MKAILKKTFIGGIALGAIAAFGLLVGNGCKGSQSVEMGPTEVVEAFNRAITAGDFAQARQLCDTVAMRDYLESYNEAWDVIMAEDSSALAIASSIVLAWCSDFAFAIASIANCVRSIFWLRSIA